MHRTLIPWWHTCTSSHLLIWGEGTFSHHICCVIGSSNNESVLILTWCGDGETPYSTVMTADAFSALYDCAVPPLGARRAANSWYFNAVYSRNSNITNRPSLPPYLTAVRQSVTGTVASCRKRTTTDRFYELSRSNAAWEGGFVYMVLDIAGCSLTFSQKIILADFLRLIRFKRISTHNQEIHFMKLWVLWGSHHGII